jgi:glycosyltransferase involved in cell wall biosynthesis
VSQCDLVCLSSADWNAPLWTNKQHLMLRLARSGVRVLYIDSLGLRRPALTTTDSLRIARRLAAWRPLAVEVEPNLLRDSPLVLPLHGNRHANAVNAALLQARVQRNLRVRRLHRPVLWTYVPQALDIFDRRRFAGLVYHCVDYVGAYPGVDAEAFERAERKLVHAADVTIASSKPLVEHLERLGARDVLYWPNPADSERFAAARVPAVANDPRVAGFAGALDPHKLDVELLAGVAERLPDWHFELVGPGGLDGSFPANVRFRGYVERERLPDVVAGFTAGIIPYRLTPYTEGVFPMKVFEYLASGLPVVSTPLRSLVGEVEHVAFAGDPEAFARSLEEQATAPVRSQASERVAYASLHSWKARTDECLHLLGRWGSPPQASVQAQSIVSAAR